MKNNKGFTMVELLGAIVVLGILMMVAIPAVKNFIDQGKESYYKTQKKNLEGAAKTYFRENHMLLREIGDSTIITMDQLVSNKYISTVKDADKLNCIGDATSETERKEQQYTFVYVKKEKNKNTFQAHLYCPSKTDDPKINMGENSVNSSPVVISISKGASLKNIVITMSSSSAKINKYSYSIFVGGRNTTSADNMIANKSEIVDTSSLTVSYDVSHLLAKNENVITCYVVTYDENGNTSLKWATFDFGVVGTPTCTNKAVVVKDLLDKFQIDYSFKCQSQNGCDNEYPSGTSYVTAQHTSSIKVDMYDKVTGAWAQCDIPYTTYREPPEPAHVPNEICSAPATTKSCPKASLTSSNWTNQNVTVCYTMSKKTVSYAYSATKVSKNGWIRKLEDTGANRRFKSKTYTNIAWNSANSKYQKKVTFKTTKKHYFVVRIKQKNSKNGNAKNAVCRTTYAYGPYRIDKTKPTTSSRSVTALSSGHKIKAKFKATDKHSYISYIYVNEKSTAGADAIKKHGKRYKPVVKSTTYSKTTAYKKGSSHVFYAHILDRAGNIKNQKIGSAKAK